MEDVPYLSAAQVLGAFFPEATLSFQDGVFTATGENLQLQATVGKAYFSVNQQYYYVPTLVVEQAGALFLPAETLAQSLGCSLTQEGEGTLTLQKTGELPTPPTYPEEDLYWLSPGHLFRVRQPAHGRADRRGHGDPQPGGGPHLPRHH